MDLRGMLNEPAEEEDPRRSASSRESSSRPPVPTLQTTHSHAVGPYSASSASQDYSEGPRSSRQPSLNSPGGQHPPPHDHKSAAFFQRKPSFSYSTGTPATPLTPGNYATNPTQQGYFTQPHQSPSRTPSSSHYPKPQYQQSPSLPRVDPPSTRNASSRAFSYSETPFGGPLNGIGEFTQPSIPLPGARAGSQNATFYPASKHQMPRASPSASASDHSRASDSPSVVGAIIAHRKSGSTLPQRSSRGESLSVSPKTVPADIAPRVADASALPSVPHPMREVTPVNRAAGDQTSSFKSEASNEVIVVEAKLQEHASNPMALSRDLKQEPLAPATPHLGTSEHAVAVTGSKRGLESPTTDSHLTQPPQKRRRVTEIPIWAQPAKHLRLLAKYKTQQRPNKQHQYEPGNTKAFNGEQVSATSIKPITRLDFSGGGPLGVYERNILGDYTPQDEHTRRICDWLYVQLVMKNHMLRTSRVGEALGSDGHIEIEAKIGTIIDKRTTERLRLPISTEAVLTGDFDVGFESIMSLQQHKAFNELLNEALQKSHLPVVSSDSSKPLKPRSRMVYKHTHEVDSFYALPDSEFRALPDHIKSIINQNHGKTPRVRVTRDQKTGQVLAKMIKARISDLHIISPGTLFDYRISVNLEANWDGDVEALAQAPDAKPAPDRHKDRVSYKHDFCQIDLTQVKPERDASNQAASHELEVELDSAVAKEQAEAVRDNKPNEFPELVQTLLDNVRILTRAIKL